MNVVSITNDPERMIQSALDRAANDCRIVGASCLVTYVDGTSKVIQARLLESSQMIDVLRQSGRR
jgi:hypothetical protein